MRKFWDFHVTAVQDEDKCTVTITTKSGKVFTQRGSLPIAILIRILGGKDNDKQDV